MIDELGIVESIDNAIKQDKKERKVTLGRALDSLYEYGVTPLFSLISQKTLKNLDLVPKYHHLDSTAIYVDGKYNSQKEKKEGVVHIKKGYSKDHRPDLNQVMLEMI